MTTPSDKAVEHVGELWIRLAELADRHGLNNSVVAILMLAVVQSEQTRQLGKIAAELAAITYELADGDGE